MGFMYPLTQKNWHKSEKVSNKLAGSGYSKVGNVSTFQHSIHDDHHLHEVIINVSAHHRHGLAGGAWDGEGAGGWVV